MADRTSAVARFITLEGPEGCGKTTMAARLVERLRARGKWVVTAREPGGTATGEAIRSILQHDAAGEPIGPEAETLLFEASRAQLCRRVILPALRSGAWVISDRFADSTMAYQGYGRGLPLDALEVMNRFAIGEAVPDLTFLLDLEVEEGFRRLEERQRASGQPPDRMEREARAFHERVRRGYLEMAARDPKRYRLIAAAREADAVFEDIWEGLRHAGFEPD
jgi:dTMP kinase